MALGEGVPTASAVLLAPVLLPYVSSTNFKNSVVFSSFNPSFSPTLCSQCPQAITDSSSTYEFCPPSLPASLQSLLELPFTGSWSCFLAHLDLQQTDVSSDLIMGVLFSLWAPKRTKPKSNQVYAYFKRRKWEKKIKLQTYWQLPELCDRQQSTFFETEFWSPNFYSWPAKPSYAYKIYVKWFIHCCSGSKRQDRVLFWHWAPSFPIDFCRSLSQYPGGDPGAHQGAPCTGNLEAENTWEPWCSLQSAGLVPREVGTWHDRRHINRQIQWQLQSCWWGCAMWNQLKNQEPRSFLHSPFHILFTFFSSLLSVSVLVVYTITLLCLFSLGTLPFTLSGFFPFLSSTFSFCFFCFPVDSQLFFLLFLLTFLPDS